MFDENRVDTAGFMAMGGLSRPIPQTGEPEGREQFDPEWGYQYVGAEAVAKALDEGKTVSAYNYYGIPKVWRADAGAYRGVLLQYRNITENVTLATVDEAVAWFEEMAAHTDG